jgi:hypothetical protein
MGKEVEPGGSHGDPGGGFCVRLDIPRYTALRGWGMGPGYPIEVASQAGQGRD